ncbi:MAG: ABC transporter ATP-binding protein [Phormidesmis sp.]
MALSAPVLSCRNITKHFGKAAAPAVDQVGFDLYEGELLGLLGPSGCGKTTLLRLMAGFEAPDVDRFLGAPAGEIELSGQVVCGKGQLLPPERRQVGVVFQDYALFPHLCVVENVKFGLKQLCRRGALPKPQIQVLAAEALSLVGLSGMEKRYPHELSGGQQQRVALARALAPRPPLILLDEPFSNLDVQVRLRLRQEVRDILKNVGASGIFVTHDQEEALAIADKVAVMDQGRLLQLDTPEMIYRHPASRFVAEFVTQANFVAAQQQGNAWETELGLLKLDLPREIVDEGDSSGDVMIAQEDLEMVADENGELLVQGRQFLGRFYQYSLLMASGQVLQVRAAASQRLAVGDRVRVIVDCEKARFFPKAGEPMMMNKKREPSTV